MYNNKEYSATIVYISIDRMGEAPLAYIVRKEFSYISSSDVTDFVKTRSAPYKQLAGGVEFIQEIPKSAAGKILRKDLRQLHGFCKAPIAGDGFIGSKVAFKDGKSYHDK